MGPVRQPVFRTIVAGIWVALFRSPSNDRANRMMVPTGCDQRSERQGWTGDSGVTADEASLNYDMGRFCKSLRSVAPAASELTHPLCRLVRRPLVAAPAPHARTAPPPCPAHYTDSD